MSTRTSEYLTNLYSPDHLVATVALMELQDAERMALSPDMSSVRVKMSDSLTVSAEAIEPFLHLLASTYETRNLSELKMRADRNVRDSLMVSLYRGKGIEPGEKPEAFLQKEVRAYE